jgi:hypothetical protein
MQAQGLPPESENQFAVDASAFIEEVPPGTRIRLLRARPETEATLARQLEIPRRLELLRRQAPPRSNTPRLLQDAPRVGATSDGACIYLVLTSIVLESGEWCGGWFIATVPVGEAEAWQAYLATAREQFVLEERPHTEGLP